MMLSKLLGPRSSQMKANDSLCRSLNRFLSIFVKAHFTADG